MASEEKYLWVFRFQIHGKNGAWWAYFSDRQETQAFIDGLMAAIPCIEARSLEEQMAGVRLYPFYYHYLYSHQ
jgi:hypothetical protein